MNPKPYFDNISNVKAIVLGADPSTNDNINFEYVFGIDSGDKRYYIPKKETQVVLILFVLM